MCTKLLRIVDFVHIPKGKTLRLRYFSLPHTWIGDDLWRVYHPGIYPGHSGPLSLDIPQSVCTMNTGDGFGHRWRRNGEFCVALGPATRIAGTLDNCVLIYWGLTPAGSKFRGDTLPLDGPHSMHTSSCLQETDCWWAPERSGNAPWNCWLRLFSTRFSSHTCRCTTRPSTLCCYVCVARLCSTEGDGIEVYRSGDQLSPAVLSSTALDKPLTLLSPASVAKQYSLVLMEGRWFSEARNVTLGLASQWPFVTLYHLLDQRTKTRKWAPMPIVPWTLAPYRPAETREIVHVLMPVPSLEKSPPFFRTQQNFTRNFKHIETRV